MPKVTTQMQLTIVYDAIEPAAIIKGLAEQGMYVTEMRITSIPRIDRAAQESAISGNETSA